MNDRTDHDLPPVHPDADGDTAVGFAWLATAILGGLAMWGLVALVWRVLSPLF